MRYLLFREDARHQDEEGRPQTFAEHLQYLRDYDGTPNCWDTAETLQSARKNARTAGCAVIIVDEMLDHRPVAKVDYSAHLLESAST
jgi:predicted RNase H-like HicB family nuclease